MTFGYVLVLFSSLFCVIQAQTAQIFEASLLNSTRFQNRRGHSAIVINNTFFIDGGDVAVWNENSTAQNYPFNLTYMIDLTKSWTNSTVQISSVTKPGPNLNALNLWTDTTNTILYSYNGEVSRANAANDKTNPPASELYQYSQATDEWPRLSTSRYDRVSWAGSTCGAGMCYAIGGKQSWRTSTAFYANPYQEVISTNMVIYNTTSASFVSSNITGLNPTNTVYQASLVHVPGFGGVAGLIVSLGGSFSNSTTQVLGMQLNPMDKITIFNPNTGTWATQTATGNIPDGRAAGCAVGVKGDNGTFEIFVYGGSAANWATVNAEDPNDILRAQIYILSLPSFTWTKTPQIPQYSRAMHTCTLVGGTLPTTNNQASIQRQMLVIGGVPVKTSSTLSRDPWTLGMNIYDMNELKWTDKYDHSLGNYVTPQIVKSIITASGKYAKSWDSKAVEGWFTGVTAGSSNGSSGSPNTGTSSSTKSNVSTIAGGAVAGAVLLVAIVTGIWYIFRRRQPYSKPNQSSSTPSTSNSIWRRRQRKRSTAADTSHSSGYHNPPELDAGIVFPGTDQHRAWYARMQKGMPPYETYDARAGAGVYEKDSSSRHHSARVELEGDLRDPRKP